jgi:hypothetical protein
MDIEALQKDKPPRRQGRQGGRERLINNRNRDKYSLFALLFFSFFFSWRPWRLGGYFFSESLRVVYG